MEIGCPPDPSVTHELDPNRRVDDPGDAFEWDRYESAGHVRQRTAGPPAPTVFGVLPGGHARLTDPKKASSLKITPNTMSPDFKSIQSALSAIGYSVATNGKQISGVFDPPLHSAISMFQQRYFSGGHQSLRSAKFRLGVLDFETAFAIQSVSQDTGP
jgi:N-acetyl-anhydromuramyl-L-alanine amidase AmpD